MLFAQSILWLIAVADPVSKHGRDEFLALLASKNPEEREMLTELSERQHRNLQNFVNGKTLPSESTLDDFAKLGGYGEFMRTWLTDIVKRTVPIKSGKAKFGIRYPGREDWKQSYQATQLPGLTGLLFPSDETAADHIFGIDCSIVDFITSLDNGQMPRDAALERIALPPDLLAFFGRIQTHTDVENLGTRDERMLAEFFVGCYLYYLAIREAALPESPRYISEAFAQASTDFLNSTPVKFKERIFDLMHRRLRKHDKGWQDICDRIPSKKSETGFMEWPSLWKAMNAEQLNLPFLWRFCCAYHDVVYPFFPTIGEDRRLLFGAVYTTLLHLSVLVRLVEDKPVVRVAPDKTAALPLDSVFVKDRIARFGEYVSFAQIQLERRKADNEGSGT